MSLVISNETTSLQSLYFLTLDGLQELRPFTILDSPWLLVSSARELFLLSKIQNVIFL